MSGARTDDYPSAALIEQLLRQYALVPLKANVDRLSSGDRQALPFLVHAASWINRIYWKQRSDFGWQLNQQLRADQPPSSEPLRRLLALGFGPWDVFDNDKPFWGAMARPKGGGHYPTDLSRDELLEYVEKHPRDGADLLSPTTLVRRQGNDLVAVPFTTAFRDELWNCSEALAEAGKHVSSRRFAEFLRARANGLVTGDLTESEALWTDVSDSPIDIAIGPYEVYDDALMGLKASYEATVLIRHPMSEELVGLEGMAAELAAVLPGISSPPGEGQRIAIGVYDVHFAAGSTNMGAKPIAAMLPNDEAIRREHGSRLLLFRNVISAKFEPILKPIALRTMEPSQAREVDEQAFVLHTLLHEMSHALIGAPQSGTFSSANQRLHDRYSTVEECRADLVGLALLDHLANRGVFPRAMADKATFTFVASCLRVLRFGAEDDYGRAAAISLSHLWRHKALTATSTGLAIDHERALELLLSLAARVQQITLSGSYDDAGKLLAELGTLPDAVAAVIGRITNVPVDLEFSFELEPSLAS